MLNNIIIIGSAQHAKDVLYHQVLKEKYGEGVIVMTPEEAIEKGITIGDIHRETLPIIKVPEIKVMSFVSPSGKERRRERRKKERKNRKS